MGWEVDHIEPKVRGGSEATRNPQAMSTRVNRSLGASLRKRSRHSRRNKQPASGARALGSRLRLDASMDLNENRERSDDLLEAIFFECAHLLRQAHKGNGAGL